ncbi:MAG: phosphotransferase [Bacteroidota bacterium]
MEAIPVLNSVISPDFLALFVQKHYNYSSKAQCSILRTGINHAYLICEGDRKAVLRIYVHGWRSREEIDAELQFLTELNEAGISVSFPLPDKKQQFVHELVAPEGLRYAVLFSFAEGKKKRQLTYRDSRQIGMLMGKMHRLSKSKTINRIDYDYDTLMELPYQHALRFFSKQNADMLFLQKAIDHAKSRIAGVEGSLRTGVVHLDLWYDNMNVDPRGKITLFDFDFCGNGWLMLDVAYTCMQLYHTEPDKKQYEKKITSFFEGYEKEEEISLLEKELVSYFGICSWAFYLGVQSRRFNDWSNIFLSENYLTHYIGLLKSWLKYEEVEIK